MQPHVVHIVRRFGRAGGMENYVWKIAHGLVERGYLVSVICEQITDNASPIIEVLKVEKITERSRWKSMRTFRDRVDELLKERFSGRVVIVHSHERSLSHQVTTFHGPPIDSAKKPKLLSFLSPRIRAWRIMERHELLNSGVEVVVPVSSIIHNKLVDNYPELATKSIVVAWPGTDGSSVSQTSLAVASPLTLRFLFVGKEFKRKGLLRAVGIVRTLRSLYPSASLDVYGPSKRELSGFLKEESWIKVKGWTTDIPWEDYDALIHPAKQEPFGMVVSEARAKGLPVLMSDQVGATDLNFSNIAALSLDSSIAQWAICLEDLLFTSLPFAEIKWTWDDLVDLHCQKIYPQVTMSAFHSE